MQSKLREFQIAMKEYDNLGVLNGPDMKLLSEQIGDPTSFKTYLFSKPETIKQILGEVKDGVQFGLDTSLANIGYKPKAKGLIDSNQPKQGSAPKPGMVEDGHKFLGGDPSNPKNWAKVK